MTNQRRVGRLQLILIGLVFLGPLVASFIVYFGGVWQPENKNINGVLLDDPPTLPDQPFSENLNTSSFRKKWSLIHVADDRCSEGCRDSLYATRQVREALNRDRGRVQRVLCSTATTVDDRDFIASEHPSLFVVARNFPGCGELTATAGKMAVYLADPLGNVIIRYEPDAGMRGMHRDLKKLLRVSRIG